MENYIQQKADINSFGKVIAIGDGVARVFGLGDVQARETDFLVKILLFLKFAKPSHLIHRDNYFVENSHGGA